MHGKSDRRFSPDAHVSQCPAVDQHPLFGQLAESLDDYQAEDKVAMMVMVKGLLGQSPYKNQVKYPKHFVRRFIVEDRTEEGMLVVFERQFKDDQTAWDKGNMLIVECKVNINPQNGKKSLVLEKLLKNCGKIDGRT